MKRSAIYFFCAWVFFITGSCYGYRIITPLPFSIVNKNYVKIQLLADAGDMPADSIICIVLYNAGSLVTQKMDASLSMVLTLNAFNDGVFNVSARVYHGQHCDTLTSQYSPSGIPVLLDRHPGYNEAVFQSIYIDRAASLQTQLAKATPYAFNGNNNRFVFYSGWNEDSVFFHCSIEDAQLNASPVTYWDLYQAKHFLEVLWTSDCIELGFDLGHHRTEWKDSSDYEFLVNISGRSAGNQWNIRDSLYRHWGNTTRVSVTTKGTLNNNADIDSGYQVELAIPWSAMDFHPAGDQLIGFDIQLYDKDGSDDEPFRASLSGTNPESNDNTSEWVTLQLVKKPSAYTMVWPWLLIPLFAAIAIWLSRKRKPAAVETIAAPAVDGTAAQHKPVYSEPVHKVIEHIRVNYHEPDLSRTSLAAQVFLSEKYLSALFKKEVGENLVSYINHYRIGQAILLLKDSRLSVSEIAFQVGYNSIQHFNKNFKTITGRAPSAYRKQA